MPSQQTIPRPHEAPEAFLTGAPVPARQPQGFLRFFFWLFVLPAIFYLSAIPVVRLPSYERWGPSHYGPALDFAYTTQGQNADVVVFGDSSAFLGIDPRLVNRQLGVKSLVLPNTAGSLPVLRDQALEFYLAHNTRPRLIVMYFTAWDLDFDTSASTHLFEGEEMLLRHDSPRQIAEFALHHPLEFAAFPLRSYSSLGPGVLKPLLRGDNRAQQAAAALGHADDSENYPPLDQRCTIPSQLIARDRAATVRALAAKYQSRGYEVAVYLAPVPDCTNASAFANRGYDGLAIAPPATLQASAFLDDGLYAHMEPASVSEASRLFADAIAKKLGK